MSENTSQTKRILKHSTIYAAGNILRQLVGFLMLPIYTRYLSPADYGVVGLLTFAMSMMEPLFGARLGEAMPKYYFGEKDEEKKHAVVSTALIVTASISAATAFALFFIRERSSTLLFGTPIFGLAVGLFGVNILTQAVEYYGMTYIRILQKPYVFIGFSLSKLVVQLTLNILLVVSLKMEVMGVVISGVASSSAYALILAGYIIFKAGYRFDKELAKKMLSFSWPLWFVGLASLYILSGNRYYIRVFSSLEEVGLYELAAKFAMILTFLVWTPFNQFWETERFNYYQQQKTSLFPKMFQLITLILVGTAVCIGIAAEPVIRIMAAPEFHNAYHAVPLLIIGTVLMCLTNFTNFSFMVSEKTRLISYISYATAVVITPLNLLLIPLYGYVGAAAALTGALLFQFLLTLRYSKRQYDMGIHAWPAILSIVAAGVILSLSIFVFFSEVLWIDICLKGLLFIGTIITFTVILWENPATQPQMSALATKLGLRFRKPAAT